MRVTEVHAAGKPRIRPSIDGRVTIVVPIKVLRRSARKQIFGPVSNSDAGAGAIGLTPFQLALLQGTYWLALLESGQANSLKEIAKRERVDPSLISRLLNLTTLAPDVVAAILDNVMPKEVTLLDIAIAPTAIWRGTSAGSHAAGAKGKR